MNCFLITTYNRPRSCKKLVKELTKFGDVYLLSDGSVYDVNESWTSKYEIFYETQEHLGKKNYHETVNKLFEMPDKKYGFYFMVPDDFFPVKNFVARAIRTWKGIKDERKICLTTFVERSRIDKACWTGCDPVEMRGHRLTQWTDLCFMSTQEFFDELGEIPKSNLNWRRKPEMGSGVGAYISSHLYESGWNLYQTKKSLFDVQPEAYKSQMNPSRLKKDSINSPIL